MPNSKSDGFFSKITNAFSFRNKNTVLRETDENHRFKAELFSTGQREQHGKNLATAHKVKPGRSRDRLLERLKESENLLLNAHNLLVSDIEAGRQITVAGEWLLDNFYIVEQQIRMARLHLPKGYSRELPHLSNTNSIGLPRVYDIAQAANQVSMGNCIGSLRTLDATDWREFVEKMSLVDRALNEDPAGVYAEMDFATRDRYRHVVEHAAKDGIRSEKEIAEQAVRLSVKFLETHEKDDPRSHVGYYLIDEGLPELEKKTGVRRPVFKKVARFCRTVSLPLYLGAILFLTALLSLVLFAKFQARGMNAVLLGIALPALILGTSHLAVALVHWLVGLIVTPRQLPRMNFSHGIPLELKTLVVVPTMLTGKESVDALFRDMEVRFLANCDPHLHFALLTDFSDSSQKAEPEDVELLQSARRKTNALNQKYPGEEGDTFFLFHRPRRWNSGEGA